MDSEFPPFPREGEDSDEERIQTQRRKWEMKHYGYTLSASSSLSYTSSSSWLLPFTSVAHGTRKSAIVPQHPKAPLQVTALVSMDWDFDSSFNSLLDNDSVEEEERNGESGDPKEKREKKEGDDENEEMEKGDKQGGNETVPRDMEGNLTQKVPIAEEYESTLVFVTEDDVSSVEVEEDSENRKAHTTEDMDNEEGDCDYSLPFSDTREENEEKRESDSKYDETGDYDDTDNSIKYNYTAESIDDGRRMGDFTWMHTLALEEYDYDSSEEELSTYEEIKKSYLRRFTQPRKNEDVATWERRLRRKKVKKELTCLKIFKDYYRIHTRLKEEDFVLGDLTEFDRRLLYGPRKRNIDGIPIDRLAKPVVKLDDEYHEAQARLEFLKQFQDELQRGKRVYLVARRTIKTERAS